MARLLSLVVSMLVGHQAYAQDAAIELGSRLGVATAPFFAPRFPRVHGHGVVLQPGAAVRLTTELSIGVELPIVMLSVEEPAGSYHDVYSWGNLGTYLQRRYTLWRSGELELSGVGRVSLALPTALHGSNESLFTLRALQLASALDAFRQQELFAAGTLPLGASYGLLLEGERFGVDADLRIPLMLRWSRAGLPRGAKTRSVGVVPVLHLGARLRALSWFDLTLGADCVFGGAASVEPAPTQCSLSPLLTFRLGGGLLLRTEAVFPLAGPLGGSTYAGGLQLGFTH